jgi:predicted RNA polymerase sigma factor
MDMKTFATREVLRELLMEYDRADVIAALGRSDLLEAIGLEAILAYVQAVAFGPQSADRRFVRNRVRALSSGLECLEVD